MDGTESFLLWEVSPSISFTQPWPFCLIQYYHTGITFRCIHFTWKINQTHNFQPKFPLVIFLMNNLRPKWLVILYGQLIWICPFGQQGLRWQPLKETLFDLVKIGKVLQGWYSPSGITNKTCSLSQKASGGHACPPALNGLMWFQFCCDFN